MLALAGCSARIHTVGIAECPTVTSDASNDHVFVRYLGVGGVLLSRGQDTILTAPLYSNPSLAEFAMDHQVRSDPMVIERLFPAEGKTAQAILVGHSHYDHLLDVPYIAENLAKDADVYGSTTTVNLLHSIRGKLKAPHVVHALDAKAADPTNGVDGEWVPIPRTRMRVLAIRSEHSDQFEMSAMRIRMPLHMFRGRQDEPLAALPERPSGWPEGPVFAYLIDFLDGTGKPEFRVYYQDSGANRPIGVPTAAQLKAWGRERVDLALICLGGEFPRLVEHPEYLIRTLRPRFALLIHWEDFFATQQAACVDEEFRSPPNVPSLFGGMRSTDVERFRKRIKKADPDLYRRTWLPCPTASTFRFPVGEGGVSESKTTFDCKPFETLPR